MRVLKCSRSDLKSNRKAVEQPSPGLPRFAATLGSGYRTGATPTGLRLLRKSNVAIENEQPTQPRWGCYSLHPSPQGSREARQPWALFRNRFAVTRPLPLVPHRNDCMPRLETLAVMIVVLSLCDASDAEAEHFENLAVHTL